MTTGYDPILFDLDGTVIDSVALIRESHRHAVREVLGVDLPDEVLTANVGRPLIDQMRVLSADRADELLAVYREWNHAHTADLLVAYDGMEDALAELRDAGRTLGIITSKSRPTVQLAFDVLPIEQHFDVIVAAEDTARHKPHPAPVLLALERLGRGTAGACYVGDAPFDLDAGRAAGVAAIAVTWGFFTRDALAAHHPTAIVDTVPRLVDVLLGR
ncbi:MAG: HAD-IA family hydrolase [Actinomycetota bacterium]